MSEKKQSEKTKVVIIGALGKDFHTFNMIFRGNDAYVVAAFTVAGEQNVGTTGASGIFYPAELAGKLYPQGIPLIPEAELETFIREKKVDEVIFSYSDVSHEEVMHKASRVLAAGADYRLITPSKTQIKTKRPMIAICGTRTGCGKSQVSRAVCRELRDQGVRVVAIREPMPYGDLVKQKCMRFADYGDFDTHHCTLEEREEYEPYIEQGLVVYSGVDYETIARQAEEEADIIVWDGGNNEVSFYTTDLLIVVADALRPGSEMHYHPGEVNVRSADCFVINKCNAASVQDVDSVMRNLHTMNPKALVIKTNSEVCVSEEHQKLMKGKQCVVVEDGPTTTHGGMGFGAGFAAVQKYGGSVAKPFSSALVGTMKGVFASFAHLKDIVPAMGYNEAQRKDLEQTLNNIPGDVVVNGSPLDLGRLLNGLNKPVARVSYDICDTESSMMPLEPILRERFGKHYKVKAKCVSERETPEKKAKH